MTTSAADRREIIDKDYKEISIARQCELLNVSKGAFYYEPVGIDPYTLMLMDLLDRQYTDVPFYGSRRMVAWLGRQGHPVNRKRVQRLMQLMRIEAIYPKPNLSKRRKDHEIYPYLLKGVKILRPNHVWSSDITYIRVGRGFVYLTAIIDWFSRYVLSWRLSNTLEPDSCVDALKEALRQPHPLIFNSDQGSQYTSRQFLAQLKEHGIQISMDSKGRALDNIFVERLWRSVKYEEVYINEYKTAREAYVSLKKYFFSIITKDYISRSVTSHRLKCITSKKKEFCLILMGASPQTPGILRLLDQSMEPHRSRGRTERTAPILRSPTRRSGCFPASPYPPSRFGDTIKRWATSQDVFCC